MAQTAELLSDRQLRTLAARQARAAKFSSPQEKSEHYRALALKSHEGRVTLSGEEAAALVDAYSLLERIAARAKLKLANASNGSE